MSNPVGRPSTYDAAVIPELLALARDGKSLAQISASLDIPRSTMQSWGKQHEEFQDALDRAKELEQAWWEDTGQSALKSDKFNSAVWSKSMSSRFKGEYTERREHSGPEGGAIPFTAIEMTIVDPESGGS